MRMEREHDASIKDYDFRPGDLVLVRNSSIEKSHNTKAKLRYYGPLMVVDRSAGGAYLIAELDGTVFHHPVAAFRVLPYLARRSLSADQIRLVLDTSQERLDTLRATREQDPEDAPLITNKVLDGYTGAALRI